VVKLIEHVAEHYDVQEVEFGRIYRWCPEGVVLECDCGKKMTHERLDLITGSEVACECGVDHSARIREEVVIDLVVDDAAIHPWHYDTRSQAEQHLRDEAAHPKDSPWRYNDVTAGNMDEG
jgi:hypothetical protein